MGSGSTSPTAEMGSGSTTPTPEMGSGSTPPTPDSPPRTPDSPPRTPDMHPTGSPTGSPPPSGFSLPPWHPKSSMWAISVPTPSSQERIGGKNAKEIGGKNAKEIGGKNAKECSDAEAEAEDFNFGNSDDEDTKEANNSRKRKSGFRRREIDFDKKSDKLKNFLKEQLTAHGHADMDEVADVRVGEGYYLVYFTDCGIPPLHLPYEDTAPPGSIRFGRHRNSQETQCLGIQDVMLLWCRIFC